MKYLKYFQTEVERSTYKSSSDFILPNVNYVVESNSVEFNPNIIRFVLNNINCEAKEGMTFKEWIFSDYFDINNPYHLYDGNSDNVRDFVTEHGSTNMRLASAAGYPFNPEVNTEDVIIANMVYSINNAGHGGQ